MRISAIRVITKLPNSEQSSKGKVEIHKYINRQNQLSCFKKFNKTVSGYFFKCYRDCEKIIDI